MDRQVPLYTLSGVQGADASTHHFSTGDKLGLSLLRFQRRASEDAVLIIHGLTTSSDMFIMPEHYNLVQYLLDHEFTDVWTVDFRMSNRYSYNLFPHRYTMDDIALFDFPAAIATMREQIGDRRIHVICHCLGSVAFLMGLFAKTVEGVTSVIANSGGLTPRTPRWSSIKARVGLPVVERVFDFPHVNPRWSEDPGLTRGKIFSKVVSKFHPECDVPACHMLSFMWGSGHPALYEHKNLLPVTHRRGGDLYGATSANYQRHVFKMVWSGNRAVKYDPSNPLHDPLPDDYLQYAEEITTPILFVTGRQNHVFSDSNIVCYKRLKQFAGDRNELHVFDGYGHQDVFMGKDVATDIFPRFLDFFQKYRSDSIGSPLSKTWSGVALLQPT